MNSDAAALTLKFLQTARRIQNKISEQLEPLDTSLQQLKVLQLVQEQPGSTMTVNEIRERMLDPMSNVSRLLNKMMEKDLIRKTRGLDDQRVVRIKLTEAGLDLYRRGGTVLKDGLTQLDGLDKHQRATLEALLDTIGE